MDSRDFCYWLNGFLEALPDGISMAPGHVQKVRQHLALVMLDVSGKLTDEQVAEVLSHAGEEATTSAEIYAPPPFTKEDVERMIGPQPAKLTKEALEQAKKDSEEIAKAFDKKYSKTYYPPACSHHRKLC